ncbi:MAG: dicarboxylate/amino acid:cation symporter [Myxococcota bacterium]|jgi:Na+/H+-dicarboxylate symporter|nr:dicarboxylate/amino acid:cation symporter [Myxococcota bacterium]
MQLYTKILIGMALGVVLGFLIGPNSTLLPDDGVEVRHADIDEIEDLTSDNARVFTAPTGGDPVVLAHGVRRMRVLEVRPGEGGDDAPDWLKVEWSLSAGDIIRLQALGLRTGEEDRAGKVVQGWVAETVPEVKRYAPIGLTLVNSTEWLGLLFLALIKMIVVPLVFFSLVVGVASLGDFRKLGRIGARTIGFFMATTAMALVIGVGLANIVKPGQLLSDEDQDSLLASYQSDAGGLVEQAAEAPGLVDQLLSIVPNNPIEALAKGDMLQIIFFALMLGIALTFMSARKSKPVVDLFDRLNEAMVMLVHIVMKLAPYGVAALLFKVIGSTGATVLLALSVYGLVVLAGLALHLTLTYGTVVRFGAGLPFWSFLKAIRPAQMLGFSTSSSSATLPVTKECAEDNLGVSPEVSSFVLPLGATINMDGTALYQGVAAIFIAQMYDMQLGFVDQVTIIVSATLASVGAAGVPGAGMITLAMVLTAVGVPTEGIALVLGVDRLLDMFRTATNLTGDSTCAVLMAKLEGEKLHILSEEEDEADPRHGFEKRLAGGPKAVHAEPDEDEQGE